MILMKFADLSQSDSPNWVMWEVKDPCPRPGWDGKIVSIKSVKKPEQYFCMIDYNFKIKLKKNK